MPRPLLVCAASLLLASALTGCIRADETWTAEVSFEVAPGSAVRAHRLACADDDPGSCRTDALVHEGTGPGTVRLEGLQGSLWLRVDVRSGSDRVTGEHGFQSEGEEMRLRYREVPGDRPGLALDVEGGAVLHEAIIRPLGLRP